jgi:hypothetical protein
MSHKIGIDFTGLCVFSTKQPKRVSALLVADTVKHMRHRPLLSFNVRNHKMYTGGAMSEVIQLPDGRQIASWDLEGRIVTLKTAGNASPKELVPCGGGVPKTRMPQDPRAEMDLCWVPSLKRITGVGDIDSLYFSPNPVPGSGESALAARVDLDQGFLFANASVNRQQPAQCWKIPTVSGGPLEQYLADTVRLEIDVETKAEADKLLVIEASRFGGRDTETLTLEPVDDKIEFSITNLPVELPQTSALPREMMHFSLYYQLLGPVPNGDKLIPMLMGDGGQMPQAPPEHSKGVERAAIEGVYPVRCTPSMQP